MRINFYDTRVAKDGTTILVKEKGINCESQKMDCPKEISRMLKTLLHMDELAEEHCYMVALNNSCRVLGIFFLSKGTVSTSLVSPREIFIRALLVGAVQVIFCHNHPSGDTVPSRTDMETTQRVKKAGELVNIPLIDHIIIGGSSYFSFSEAKML